MRQIYGNIFCTLFQWVRYVILRDRLSEVLTSWPSQLVQEGRWLQGCHRGGLPPIGPPGQGRTLWGRGRAPQAQLSVTEGGAVGRQAQGERRTPQTAACGIKPGALDAEERCLFKNRPYYY